MPLLTNASIFFLSNSVELKERREKGIPTVLPPQLKAQLSGSTPNEFLSSKLPEIFIHAADYILGKHCRERAKNRRGP